MFKSICVYGVGAVGGLLAAHLAKSGADVSVVARGEQRSAIAKRGLTVRHSDGSVTQVRPDVLDDPADLRGQDAIIVSVKAHAIPDVANALAATLPPDVPIVFVTNGIPWWYADGDTGPFARPLAGILDPDRLLHETVGVSRTIGSVIYTGSTVVEPGVIESKHASVKLILGEPDGRMSDRLHALAGLFECGGLSCQLTNQIRAAVWAKLMTNIASGPLCLLSRQSMKRTFADPTVRAASVRIVEEGMAVAGAILGHPLEGHAEERVGRLVDTDHKPSILVDLELGRRLETEALFTLPLRLARMAGVPIPMLELMVALSLQAVAARAV